MQLAVATVAPVAATAAGTASVAASVAAIAMVSGGDIGEFIFLLGVVGEGKK